MTDRSLIAHGLVKRYGAVLALDRFDLEVDTGSVHGLLGPNGAGKSTAVRALATLIEVDAGTASVDGHDIRSHPERVRRRIGLVGQSAAVDDILSGVQNLVMFGRLFGLDKREARRRADELLERFELTDAASRTVGTYSGGMRRRLDIAASLILTPAVLFLDEPTTGLDPKGRNEVWRAVRDIADLGTTVLLTTQYLDEADRLADRISVMKDGTIIAEGSPVELKREFGGDQIVIVVADEDDLPAASAILGRMTGAEVVLDRDLRSVSSPTSVGAGMLANLVRALDAQQIAVDDLGVRRPTLDEVFLALTEVAA